MRWICPDEQRWDTIGALGNPYARTPTLHHPVAEGAGRLHPRLLPEAQLSHPAGPPSSPGCTPAPCTPAPLHPCTNGNGAPGRYGAPGDAAARSAGYDSSLAGKPHLSATAGAQPPAPHAPVTPASAALERAGQPWLFSLNCFDPHPSLGGDVREGFSVEHGTMERDRRHKLVVYHGHEPGELFDLRENPGEFVNLRDDPACPG